MRKSFFAAVAAAFLGVAALAVPAMAFAPNVTIQTRGSVVPNDPIIYEDGRMGALSDFRGEVLVITLWQEHCPFCRKEMPSLERLSAETKGTGIRVVPLALDQDMGLVTRFLDQNGYENIPAIIDQDKFVGSILTVEALGTFSIPTPSSYIVDKNGVLRASVYGLLDWNAPEARAYLNGLAAE